MDLKTRTFNAMVGKTIVDRYELQELVGTGGMGAVFKGVQRTMSRQVAIKILPKLDPLTAARFHREAKTASRLSHPNTITIFDFGQTAEGFLFLVMEFLSGRSLKSLIKEIGPMAPRRAIHLVSQICRSLSEAHDLGIVHRDIKPDNVFLVNRNDDPDFVKVLDFGIAKVMMADDDDEDLTQQGRIVGTPRYMAPEQALGLPVDYRTDIYSLGVLLYHLVTGTPPFQDNSSAMLMMKHAQENPDSFAERMGEEVASLMPLGLESVVMKALAKDPDLRQQNVDVLRTELELVVATISSGYGRIEEARAPRPSDTGTGNRSFSKGDPYQVSVSVPQPKEVTDTDPSLSHPALRAPEGMPGRSASSPVVQRYQSSNQNPQVTSPPPDPITAPTPAFGPDDSASGAAPVSTWKVWAGWLLALGTVLALGTLGVSAIVWHAAQSEPEKPPEVTPAPAAAPDLNSPAAVTPPIRITSTPGQAEVFSGEDKLGTTPLVVQLETESALYEIRKDGYHPTSRRFQRDTVSSDGAQWHATLVAIPSEDVPEKLPVAATPAPVPDDAVKTNNKSTRRRGNKTKAQRRRTDGDSAPATPTPSAATPARDDSSGGNKTPPPSGGSSDAVKERKPKVDLLDGGPDKKPKVGIIGGSAPAGTKEKKAPPKVEILE